MNFPEWSLLMARKNRLLNELFTNTAADENIFQIYAFPVPLPSLQLLNYIFYHCLDIFSVVLTAYRTCRKYEDILLSYNY